MAPKARPDPGSGRPLTDTEEEHVRRCIRSLRQRKADAFGDHDNEDLDALLSQLEVVRVIHESADEAAGGRHLHLDNALRAAHSVPIGRMEVRHGTCLTLYEDPDYGLLTELRYSPYRGPEVDPEPACPPDAIRNLLDA